MKTLYVSFAWLIIIILAWYLIYYFSIDNAIKYFDIELKNIYNAVINENYNEAQMILNKVMEKWKDTEKLWIYFVHQGEVEDIIASIQKMDSYIKTENKSMTLSEIEEFKKFLRKVMGNESITLENIF